MLGEDVAQGMRGELAQLGDGGIEDLGAQELVAPWEHGVFSDEVAELGPSFEPVVGAGVEAVAVVVVQEWDKLAVKVHAGKLEGLDGSGIDLGDVFNNAGNVLELPVGGDGAGVFVFASLEAEVGKIVVNAGVEGFQGSLGAEVAALAAGPVVI